MTRAARSTVLIVLVAIGLIGCGKFYWTKPGGTYEQFDRDSSACARDTSPNPTAASHGAVAMEAYRACLIARGWTRQQHPVPPPDAYRGFE
jgi:hypothetical protein